ncbi:hypothetical protein BST81_03705 [Leptolyngbya sp. 'hensonii']|uniref:DUF2808 domain-containing protein n=1 Tax=Leptolyngbya sp. 'hensonii' TaxID=1922337 RepID=UPI00094F74DF|nr:DUF2808 domain-containing protein [Leptolyngbya sp. 'hensonii']OLP19658.1 hypothetical protein BST81_03705 [Leptolyngbya sp. 'hensonii']
MLKQRILPTLAIAGCLLSGLPAISMAQGLPGLTLFGNVKGENQLNYRLDFGGKSDAWDRYRLRISGKKMKLAVSKFSISYPDYFDGKFDVNDVEIISRDKSVPLDSVKWDEENHFLEITPKEPIPAGFGVEIILSNVKNPAFGGMYYFNCQILTPGDVPLLRYIGTWVITVQ